MTEQREQTIADGIILSLVLMRALELIWQMQGGFTQLGAYYRFSAVHAFIFSHSQSYVCSVGVGPHCATLVPSEVM